MIAFNVYSEHRLLKRVLVSKDEITIGRSDGNDLILENAHVSRVHFVIRLKQGRYWIEDKSSNGLELDGIPLQGIKQLPTECKITLFPFEIDCLCQEEDLTRPLPETDADTDSPVLLSRRESAAQNAITYHFGSMIGDSPAMQNVYRCIQAISNKEATVLIRGENGTGKELVVRAIHTQSGRKDGPLISVNCAAIPEHLMESELFGYEKGAFSGAASMNKGKIGGAIGGTLFLDEIGELSLATQAKLLRFLQDKSFMRLGSDKEIKADVRVVAATNRDLEKAVDKGTFREDLYYRIKVLQVTLPPLRERSEDIPRLIDYFVLKFTAELGLSSVPLLKPEQINQLKACEWRGNIRELSNTLYRAIVHSEPPHLIDEDLLFSDGSPATAQQKETQHSFADASKELLLKVLKGHQGDTQKTAEQLGVSRATVYNRLKKYGIDPKKI